MISSLERELGGPEQRKVLVADQHPIVCAGVTAILTRLGVTHFQIAGKVDDFRSALTICKPDLVVYGPRLRDDLISLFKEIKRGKDSPYVLVLSETESPEMICRLLRAGVDGIVAKSAGLEEIENALLSAVVGKDHIGASLVDGVMGHLRRFKKEKVRDVYALSDREIEVLTCIGRGFGTSQLAKNLGISPKTVDSHKEHIKNKLNLQCAAQLQQFAYSWAASQNLISASDAACMI